MEIRQPLIFFLDSKKMSKIETSRSLEGMVVWYVILGALHEVCHVVASWWISSSWILEGASGWYSFLLERHVAVESVGFTDDQIDSIRQAGWIGSLLLALTVELVHRQYKLSSSLRTTAWVTVLEALATDALGWGPCLPLSTTEKGVVFYCGNFGIILLHHLWLQDKSNNALDCLEQMVHVTMMRGAQSGGVVTFQPNDKGVLQGIRCRVVNKKRTDLSQEIRKRVPVPQHLPKDFVPTLSGHTRFATSSLSTLEGTHPHQWQPPTLRRIYDQTNGVRVIRVENFITHNGDFEFFSIHGNTFNVDVVLEWIQVVTHVPVPPARADSCGIAGMVDVIRTQGCFGLSARYALCLGLETSLTDMEQITASSSYSVPTYTQFEQIGVVFEQVLAQTLKDQQSSSLSTLGDSITGRHNFAMEVARRLKAQPDLVQALSPFLDIQDDEEGSTNTNIFSFCTVTINAFFDNDLLFTTQCFLKHAKGSFGLCVMSSLDANRQMALAARGQTMSIAFFPDKGLICYGSEQAAVKAGLNAKFPGEGKVQLGSTSSEEVDLDATRLDLDDLGGEIVLLDWSSTRDGAMPKSQNPAQSEHNDVPPVSKPNRNLSNHWLMNGKIQAVIYQETKSASVVHCLYNRLTRLTRNELIQPLAPPVDDPILADIQDIPRVCKSIQEAWDSNKASTGLNRLTAFHLSKCLRSRLEAMVKGAVSSQAVDILLTGCEVSLWLAEQFASDLQKCFPKLRIQALSSNKILGMYGQEIAVPSLGFPYTAKTSNYHNSIVIIVSHSGGTFAPLACSKLLQSVTKNIFVVTSEWDTQIGKNLRMISDHEDGGEGLFNHRIFTTDIGIRPAEPCSVSVVATHQLLTNLLEYVSVVILSDPRFRRVTGAVMTAMDIQVLERCNQMNINALTEIVGVNRSGFSLDRPSQLLLSLRQAGDLWAEHILENSRAYIMSFIYIFATVISGYPLVYGVARAAGLDSDSDWVYLAKAVDAAIYFFLPQICIILIRLYQGRNLLHRMVGRTIVIGDIPWVAQSADAFLSKIFAVSYSIAGVNVLHGNPADHLVHRHTHRVVRGTLAVFGRPDGRLSALSTAEASVCLSVNQASSIQSHGGTCESITIGHNPFKLDLSLNGIFLKRNRPLFLCERLLVEKDAHQERTEGEKSSALVNTGDGENRTATGNWRRSLTRNLSEWFFQHDPHGDESMSFNNSMNRVHDCSVSLRMPKQRSAPALLGAYMNIQEAGKMMRDGDAKPVSDEDEGVTVEEVVRDAIADRKHSAKMHKLFDQMDVDKDGFLNEEEFVAGVRQLNPNLSETEAQIMFRQMDSGGVGMVDYDEFATLMETSSFNSKLKVPKSHRDARGMIQIEATQEKYFGETIRKYNAGKATSPREIDFELARRQHLVQELYETRVASLQRFVSLTVLFHHMGKRVENFFSTISFGWWSYRMDRTHSIMRIATTASPVSGADVRVRMTQWRLLQKVHQAVDVISSAYLSYKKRKEEAQLKELLERATKSEEEKND